MREQADEAPSQGLPAVLVSLREVLFDLRREDGLDLALLALVERADEPPVAQVPAGALEVARLFVLTLAAVELREKRPENAG